MDITKCTTPCPSRDKCLRALAKPRPQQGYAYFDRRGEDRCDDFIPEDGSDAYDTIKTKRYNEDGEAWR